MFSKIASLTEFIQGLAFAMFVIASVLQVNGVLTSPGADLARIIRLFSIRHGQIIQPTASQANGARYLNDTVTATNEDCLIWCWETTQCNVAIFGTLRVEEVQGRDVVSRKCYLFDCGPGSRLCSFTENENYITSCLTHGLPNHAHGHSQLQKQTGTYPYQLTADDSASQGKSSIQDLNNSGNESPLGGCFRCLDDSSCISTAKLCNGEIDCRDRSDETSCQNNIYNKSNKNYFRYRGGEPEDQMVYAADSSVRLKSVHHRPDQADSKAKGHSHFGTSRIGQERHSTPLQSQAQILNAKETSTLKVKKPDQHDDGYEHDSPSMSISLTQVDSGEKHASPAEAQSGVILAIALGLCVTALLLVLVGCKLRLVRRRLVNWRRENRKGLSLLADDDDDDDDDDEDEDAVHGII
ncbi:uncharacterized protein LOC111271646 isoform X2 [Varroa jacobsoni]|uniref:uncharacterized protein LOC111271646 isoform X2 n=1 Tax=Varroa jacobsoni TaxID=62625 RepID=UPI000BF52112|nr:uncharacterized protein LOC111271646 isoform X2 [Varroa jacobsoni]